MLHDPFMWVLATATLLTGVVLSVMLVKRLREARAKVARRGGGQARATPRTPTPAAAQGVDDDEPAPQPDYFTPAEWSPELEPDEPGDGLIKICPRCGSRYANEYRHCTRDDAELSALN